MIWRGATQFGAAYVYGAVCDGGKTGPRSWPPTGRRPPAATSAHTADSRGEGRIMWGCGGAEEHGCGGMKAAAALSVEAARRKEGSKKKKRLKATRGSREI